MAVFASLTFMGKGPHRTKPNFKLLGSRRVRNESRSKKSGNLSFIQTIIMMMSVIKPLNVAKIGWVFARMVVAVLPTNNIFFIVIARFCKNGIFFQLQRLNF